MPSPIPLVPAMRAESSLPSFILFLTLGAVLTVLTIYGYREYQRRMSIRRLVRLREDVMQEVRAHLVDDDDDTNFGFNSNHQLGAGRFSVAPAGASPQEIEMLRQDRGHTAMNAPNQYGGGPGSSMRF
ncbi:hypothetical protein FOZ63_025548 [Perkinsus olseni]|uniref:Uncharacterized protein n=1 Tax=Perkinsus olseni TaxID=32597 RepID=A0A7J6R0W1_PEROL|nr:hypothetical protein FOZ63_025548 [Perkinsus olseni]